MTGKRRLLGMASRSVQVNSIGNFIDTVEKFRYEWGLKPHQELWFRGEAKDYEDTKLRPNRPTRG